MLENDGMETAKAEVTSIWRQNNIANSTWKTHRYFVGEDVSIEFDVLSLVSSPRVSTTSSSQKYP